MSRQVQATMQTTVVWVLFEVLVVSCVTVASSNEFCRNEMTNEESEQRCTPEAAGSQPCSGRGQCICGMCNCDAVPQSFRRFSGMFCECDDYSCPYSNQGLCGGPERGTCHCGQCMCREGFEGLDCSFSLATDRCRDLDGGLCNNQGICVSNRCRCSGNYMGPTCEDHPLSPGVCVRLKPCVACYVFGEGCPAPCSSQVRLVDSVPRGEGWRQCLFRTDDACLLRFAYRRSPGGGAEVRAEITQECPSPLTG